MEPVTEQNYRSGGFWETNRALIKSLLIGALTLLMLIPASFIQDLVRERQSRQEEVIREVCSSWALSQTITGPIVMIPYLSQEIRPDKSVVNVKKFAFLMPDKLNTDSKVSTETRHRSIFDVSLYRSTVELSGTFAPIDLAAAGIPASSIYENEIRLLTGISDVRGLEEEVVVDLNEVRTSLDASLPVNELVNSGLSKILHWDRSQPLNFRMHLQLRGSADLNFVPIAKSNQLEMLANWKHPSFSGKFLPSTHEPASDSSVRAHWNVLQVSSGIPTLITDQNIHLEDASMGVRFLQPADGYGKTQRSAKYALLFIALTFAVFFFMEVLRKKQIHPLQYLLVGLALCVFYTLLLSFTEYCGFNLSYAVAASATVLLVGCYIWSIFGSARIGASFTTALGILYTYIFVLIQLEDWALLFGSIGLFLLLAIIMFFSRKIDWYAVGKQKA